MCSCWWREVQINLLWRGHRSRALRALVFGRECESVSGRASHITSAAHTTTSWLHLYHSWSTTGRRATAGWLQTTWVWLKQSKSSTQSARDVSSSCHTPASSLYSLLTYLLEAIHKHSHTLKEMCVCAAWLTYETEGNIKFRRGDSDTVTNWKIHGLQGGAKVLPSV